MSQQQGNDLAAPEPLANTEPDKSAQGTIEDKLNTNRSEAIRKIWRPILDKTIHPQEMAYLISQCVDETEAIITTETTKARQETLSKVLSRIERCLDTNEHKLDKKLHILKDDIADLQKEQKQ